MTTFVNHVAPLFKQERGHFVRATSGRAQVRCAKRTRAPILALEQTTSDAPKVTETFSEVVRKQWDFRGFRLEYIEESPRNFTADAPCILLVHGFGANCLHFRKNISPLSAAGYRVFALDLIGFGMGDKPAPGMQDAEDELVSYTFPYWSSEIRAFVQNVIRPGGAVYAVSNSIGCVASLQAGVDQPTLFQGHVLISPSLRLLNVRKRNALQGAGARVLQTLLSIRPIGSFFLNALSKPDTLRAVLKGAYSDHTALTDELVGLLQRPALTDGALEVFLAFISYDQGPIPEDLLPVAGCDVHILWGDEDGFEPLKLGRALGKYDTVRTFEELPGVGHCAHDEAPELTHTAILKALRAMT